MGPASLFRNRILSALPEDEQTRVKKFLSPVTLEQQFTLLDGETNYCYFLEDGIASVVVTVGEGETVEVGLIGREGIVGISALLGARSIPGRTFMQIAGHGHRIATSDMKAEFDKAGSLRELIQRYMLAVYIQAAQTAACNRHHNIEERLARWLLSCRDRMEKDELRLTQEFLGQMIGAPRTTVTLAAGMLQKAGMIDHSRGTVTIKDRALLEETACECYFIVKEEFQKFSLL